MILLIVLIILVILFVVFILNKNRNTNKVFHEDIKYDFDTNEKRYIVNESSFAYGEKGEEQIKQMLDRLDINEGRCLYNLFVEKRSGRYSEIDAVVISKAGIFVIESKYFSGKIIGRINYEKWRHVRRNGEVEMVFNPISQNSVHLKALKDYLNLDEDDFKSYVVFSNQCSIANVPKNGDNFRVLNTNDLLYLLKKDMRESVQRFSEYDVDDIYDKLLDCTNVDEEIIKKHTFDVKKIQA